MRASPLLNFFVLPLAFGFPHFGNLLSEENSVRLQQLKQELPIQGTTLKPNHFKWKPPGLGDLRSPCPALNTLANHGFLPRDGRNITLQMITTAAKDGLNIGPLVPLEGFTRSVVTNPIPNATFIDLAMIHKHNVIEHDASVSRRDSFFDPTNKFDAATFDNFLSYFGDDQAPGVVSVENARARHTFDMSKLNPEFGLTRSQVGVIQGEVATMLGVFGNAEAPFLNRTWFEFFIRNERFPVHLGWSPRPVETDQNIRQIVLDMQASSPTDIPLVFDTAAA